MSEAKAIDRDSRGWYITGNDNRLKTYQDALAFAKGLGIEHDNAGWLKYVLMWNWHNISFDGYPGWELDPATDNGYAAPHYVKLSHQQGKGPSSDDLRRKWDDKAEVLFYTRDYSDTGSIFLGPGDTYRSGWWFQTKVERDRFVAWVKEQT